MEEPQQLKNQVCPICHAKQLTLTEHEQEIPYFGRVFLYSMNCEACKYHKADIECAERRDPCKFAFEISSEEDLKVRVVKSGEATVKLPFIMTIEPGPSSNGYVTNIEGILNRVKHAIEIARDAEEEPEAKKKAKNMLKKLQKVMWGQDTLKITIEDPSGNSAIISDKAVKGKL